MAAVAGPPHGLASLFIAVFAVSLAIAPGAFPARDQAVARRAQALARGAADASGRAAPLLVHDGGERWYQPLAVYPAALLVRIGVPAPTAVRLPSIVAAALSAFLTYLLALRLCQPSRLAAVAVLLLVASPAWAAYGSAAGADFWLVAAILGWLVSIVSRRERMSMGAALFGGLVLGLGSWTQPAGVLAVPLFFLVGVALMSDRQRSARVLAAASCGAAIPLLACGVWLAMHPDAYADTFGRWAIHAAHVRNPWLGLVAVTKWDVMARRTAEYWAYLNPTFLFDGRALFSIGMSVLVAAGLWFALDPHRRPLVVGFLVTPLAAALLDMPRDASLVLAMAPLGAILGTIGVEWILARRGGRLIVFVLFAVIFASRALAALV